MKLTAALITTIMIAGCQSQAPTPSAAKEATVDKAMFGMTLGAKGLKDGTTELRDRRTKQMERVPFDQLVAAVNKDGCFSRRVGPKTGIASCTIRS